LDPACGTAGFLISSFNHIQNKNKKDGRVNLTADERTRLINNFSGYDISPDMVRLSLVNMYLHKFPAPKIYEYDTLTSEEKWNEVFDVILANPPFMSPKGGIKPHKRFSVQAKRSEVLFVDYIAEHLNPNGRAGIIVPEGIIFQSGNAYKKLRKMLIENSLYVVVSLPAGVFNPYSGVKTSILFLNKNLAKKTNKILFVKVNNDGFGLGAQRRKIQENDLPDAYRAIMEYKQTLISGDKFNEDTWRKIKVIEKCKIAKGGDYNLSGIRYGVAKIHANIKWPMVEIGEVVDIESGSRQKGGAISSGVSSIGGGQINEHGDIRFEKMKYITNEHFQSMKKGILKQGDVLIVKDGATTGKTGYFDSNEKSAVNEHVFILRARHNILSKYLYNIIRSEDFQQKLKPYIKGIIGGISLEVKGIKIPLPSLVVQEQIAAELDSYQKIIDGAKQVVENYKPTFKIDPEWETVELGDVCKFVRGPFGGALKKEIFVEKGYKVYEQKHAIQNNFTIGEYYITSDKFQEMKRFEVKSRDLIVSCSGTMGKIAIVPQNIERGIINQALLKLRPDYNKINSMYMKLVLETPNIQIKYFQNTSGAAIKNVSSVKYLQTIRIPLPSIEIQQQIIAQIEKEQKVINANKELINIFKNKIKDKIADVWGE
ncbi:MAG: N-6 DNA methylase, partial [Actinomycetia bacterium]|nr:N-6 DNA methylase [Actinomycetes bacterium]